MPVPVFDFKINYALRRTRLVDRVRLDLGKGFTKTVIKTQAATRADGQGAVTSYKGQNIFDVPILKKDYDGDGKFKSILDFLQKRIDAGDEKFYFYHPDELFPPDATGVNTTGRYTVKFLGDLGDVLTKNKQHDFVNLTFEESLF